MCERRAQAHGCCRCGEGCDFPAEKDPFDTLMSNSMICFYNPLTFYYLGTLLVPPLLEPAGRHIGGGDLGCGPEPMAGVRAAGVQLGPFCS